jgi:hypothetical protein
MALEALRHLVKETLAVLALQQMVEIYLLLVVVVVLGLLALLQQAE